MVNPELTCSLCSRPMVLRVVELSATLPEGESVGDIIEDRCNGCRDDYGVRLDALRVHVEAAETQQPTLNLESGLRIPKNQ